MEIPSKIKTYCPYCRKHTIHSLKRFKAKKARTLAWGTRQNLRVHKKGFGGKAEFKILVRKQNKKPTYLATCSECGKKHYFVIEKRMKEPKLVSG
jgi:large subunit ribosomal protein L44e